MMAKIKITTTGTITEKEMWVLFEEQLEAMEKDLIALCEDNENMAQAIKDYFSRAREEHKIGTA
jgi:hypothetical protein